MSLRQQRRDSGLTQAELAARAGVSRQLVAAVEAGRHTPGSRGGGPARAGARNDRRGAVRRGRFGERSCPRSDPTLGRRIGVRLGRVGDRLVAAELPDHGVAGASWANPDGLVVDGIARPFAHARAAGLVVAGCDPALGIAEAMLAGLGDRSLLAISAPTGAALGALGGGVVHAAWSTVSPASFRPAGPGRALALRALAGRRRDRRRAPESARSRRCSHGRCRSCSAIRRRPARSRSSARARYRPRARRRRQRIAGGAS